MLTCSSTDAVSQRPIGHKTWIVCPTIHECLLRHEHVNMYILEPKYSTLQISKRNIRGEQRQIPNWAYVYVKTASGARLYRPYRKLKYENTYIHIHKYA